MIRPLIYTLMAGLQTLTLVYDVLYVPNSEGSWFMKLKFLTVIFMTAYTFYLVLCAVRSYIDYWGSDKTRGPHRKHPGLPNYYWYTPLHAIIDTMYSVFVFPVGMFVVVMFWVLFTIDRELVFPEHLDEIIPNWMNQMMHTAPVMFILVDTLLVCHHLPSNKNGMVMHSSLVGVYLASLCVWALCQGYWAYPILDVLNLWQRAVFFLATMVFSIALFYMGHLLNSVVWGRAAYAEPKKSRASSSISNGDGTPHTYNTRKKVRKD